MKNQALALGLSMLITLLTTSPASAARLFNTYNLDSQFFADADPHVLNIRKNGSSVKNITLIKTSKVHFTLTAECRDFSPAGSWVALIILVDGIPLPQTTDDQAFCSGNDEVGGAGWTSGAISGADTLEPGTHEITVVAQGFFPGTDYRIDDINIQIVVEKK